MNMKKWLLLLIAFGLMPWGVMAQDDDDMYFVPSKKSASKPARSTVTTVPGKTGSVGGTNATTRDTYYSGSNRDVDEYNRRGSSYYQMPVVPADSVLGSDIISFSGEQGVYPDSVIVGDYGLTQQMSRWDGYEPSESYWAGYAAGSNDAWHSPWYYTSYYPWYDSWYYPWRYNYYGWYGGWYDPWYSWYDPWYYNRWYGYYGYYGYYGFYDPFYYGPGHNVGRPLQANNSIGLGTMNRYGRTHGKGTGFRGGSSNDTGYRNSGYSSGAGSRTSANVRNRSLESRSSGLNSSSTLNNSRSSYSSRANTNTNNVRSTNTSNMRSTNSNTSYSSRSANTSTSSFGSSSRSSSSGGFGGGFSGGGGRSGGGGGGGGARSGGSRR